MDKIAHGNSVFCLNLVPITFPMFSGPQVPATCYFSHEKVGAWSLCSFPFPSQEGLEQLSAQTGNNKNESNS